MYKYKSNYVILMPVPFVFSSRNEKLNIKIYVTVMLSVLLYG